MNNAERHEKGLPHKTVSDDESWAYTAWKISLCFFVASILVFGVRYAFADSVTVTPNPLTATEQFILIYAPTDSTRWSAYTPSGAFISADTISYDPNTCGVWLECMGSGELGEWHILTSTSSCETDYETCLIDALSDDVVTLIDTPPQGVGGATSTIEQAQSNLAHAFYLFLASTFFMVWLMRKH